MSHTISNIADKITWENRQTHLHPKWYQEAQKAKIVAYAALAVTAALIATAFVISNPIAIGACAVGAVVLLAMSVKALTKDYWDDPNFRNAQGKAALKAIEHEQMDYKQIMARFGTNIKKYQILKNEDLEAILLIDLSKMSYADFKNRHGEGPVKDGYINLRNAEDKIFEALRSCKNYRDMANDYPDEIELFDPSIIEGFLIQDLNRMSYSEFQKKHGSGPVADLYITKENAGAKIVQTLKECKNYNEMQKCYPIELKLFTKPEVNQIISEQLKNKPLSLILIEQRSGFWTLLDNGTLKASDYTERAQLEIKSMTFAEVIKTYGWNLFKYGIVSPSNSDIKAKVSALNIDSFSDMHQKFGYNLLQQKVISPESIRPLLEKEITQFTQFEDFIKKVGFVAFDEGIVTENSRKALERLYLKLLRTHTLHSMSTEPHYTSVKIHGILPTETVTKLETLRTAYHETTKAKDEAINRANSAYNANIKAYRRAKESAIEAANAPLKATERDLYAAKNRETSLLKDLAHAQTDEGRAILNQQLRDVRTKISLLQISEGIQMAAAMWTTSSEEGKLREHESRELRARDSAISTAHNRYIEETERQLMEFHTIIK